MRDATIKNQCIECGQNLHRYHIGDLCRMCKIKDEEHKKEYGPFPDTPPFYDGTDDNIWDFIVIKRRK